MSGGQWHENLFDADKSDSLGDGSWGRTRSDEPSGPAPVAWDDLPPAPKKKRARLATPAPGSQMGSGLLDIQTLTAQLSTPEAPEAPTPARPRQSTPLPARAQPARLATSAKASSGSGLIDVQELVRLQQEQEAAESGQPDALPPLPNTSSSSLSATLLSSSDLSGSLVAEVAALDAQLPVAPPKSRALLWVMVGVLLLAFVGLALYVVSQG